MNLETRFQTPEYQPTGNEIAIIRTAKGDIAVKLEGTRLPIHVGGFVELAHSRFYEGLKFFRMEEGLSIKGGCPTTRHLPPDFVKRLSRRPIAGIGVGSAGYWLEHEELDPKKNRHERGALVMSYGAGFNFSSCQFQFCLAANPAMNTVEPVIGYVVSGEEVMDALELGDEILEIIITDGAE